MSIKKTTQLIGVLSVMMVGAMVLTQTASAEESIWMRWDITADLTKGEPDVRLVVETGFYDEQGEWQQVDSADTQLICEVNDVEFTEGGSAVFNGEGYIACEMVDVLAIAAKLSGGETAFPEAMGGSGTHVAAKLSPTEYGHDNPVFYHPDIQFQAANVGEAYLGLEVGGLTAKSGGFTPAQHQRVYSEFGQSGDSKVHYPTFVVDKETLEATPEVLNGVAPVSNVYEGLIYIGYSPETDTYFAGEIFSIDVDPGCSGYG